jgi:hypothetical protein
MSQFSLRIGRTHAQIALRMNVQRDFIASDPLVGEMPDDVSRDRTAKLPAVCFRKGTGVRKEFARGNVGPIVEIALPLRERGADVAAQLVLHRIASENERAPEIGFPGLEDRTEVQEHDIVVADRQVRRVLAIRLERVCSGTNDALVPVPLDAKEFFSQRVDRFVEIFFGDTRPNEIARFDFAKELLGFDLRFGEPRGDGEMVRSEGFEPPTPAFGGQCSIQLSYERPCRYGRGASGDGPALGICLNKSSL